MPTSLSRCPRMDTGYWVGLPFLRPLAKVAESSPWNCFRLGPNRTLHVFRLPSTGTTYDRRYSRDSLPAFSVGGHCEQFGQGCPLSDVVHPAFPLPTTASPTLQGALKDGFGEAVMACDMPEPGKFPCLNSCQKMLLLTHKKVDLAPHPAKGLVLQVGNAGNFLKQLVSKAWIPFTESASRVHVSQP